ncbi:MAG TPA: site-specific DNA-methyltransferase [Thermoflexales bacterium]|nr:site-specific DNA-methyltransferase [Thermoflexales bacterium]
MPDATLQAGTITQGDCLDVLPRVAPGSAQLIYLDPPFNTRKTRRGTGDSTDTYADHFGATGDYIAFLKPRLAVMQRALAPNGSLFFHGDWRAGHYVKVLLDELFRVESPNGGVFVNEIIWRYGLGAARARRNLLTKHDVIFWYAASPDYVFNLIRQAPTAAMLNKYRHVDADGQRFMRSYGKVYTMKGGKPLDDVWEIPTIAPTSRERTGYPTQKPLALLERIIALASAPGDLVIDPFCGSGTTLLAAQRLGRRWLGIDASAGAVEVARGRLADDSKVEPT